MHTYTVYVAYVRVSTVPQYIPMFYRVAALSFCYIPVETPIVVHRHI